MELNDQQYANVIEFLKGSFNANANPPMKKLKVKIITENFNVYKATYENGFYETDNLFDGERVIAWKHI